MQPLDMFHPDAVHVVIDLETLGTRPGSTILQIGASSFKLASSKLGSNVGCAIYIDPMQSKSAGFTEDRSTGDWWNNQNPETRKVVFSGTTSPFQALIEFNTYMKGFGDKRSVYVWGNSPRFDCGLLEAYYQHYALEIPWEFRNERDLRTLAALLPRSCLEAKVRFTNDNPHNGYWDAAYEAQVSKYLLAGEGKL